MGNKLIIADDELDLKCLNTAAGGWSVKTAEDGNEALKLIQRFRNAVVAVVIDLEVPDEQGLTVLRQIRRTNPELPVVAMTRSDRPEVVAEVLEAGATECAFKPLLHEELVRILQRATKGEAVCQCEASETAARPSQFLYLNQQMGAIQQSLRKLAPWNVPVVFLGETGVGKEVAARELHRLSNRAHKPFIKINCAAVPSELLESELFGYEKGAFTGALRSKPGKFELADGGTILLDEIGDMHPNLQSKLLQVLQDGEFDRLGGRQSIRVDVRVLAATHRDLRRAVETGSFREDLFYRLNVASILIPPLRERQDEIIPLAEKFIVKHGKESGAQLPEISLQLRQALLEYPWPGNVRELENTVRRFLVFQRPDVLASELWERIAERPHAAASAAKTASRPAQAGAAMRNGSNKLESVRSFPSRGAFANGAANDFASATFPIKNGSASELGTSRHDEDFGLVHRSNGAPVSEPEYIHLAISRQERPEELLDGTVDPSDSLADLYADDNDFESTNGNGAVKYRSLESGIDTDFQNGEPVSTLSQVEELSKEFERRTILAALQRATWNRKKAAKMLDIDYKGLLYKMKKLQIA